MPPLANRYRQVMLTYTRRGAFHVLAAATCAWLALALLHYHYFDWRLYGSAMSFLLEWLYYLAPWMLLVALVAMVMGHVREQVDGWRVALVPNYRQPHLRVAQFTLLLAALAAGYWLYDTSRNPYFPPSLLGSVAMPMSLVAVAAWLALFRNPWLSLLLVPLCMMLLSTNAGSWLFDQLLNEHAGPRVSLFLRDDPLFWMAARMVLLVAGLAALMALGWRRMRWIDQPPGAAWARGQDRRANTAMVESKRGHQLVSGLFARALHRRVHPFGQAAPWVLAGVLALVLVLIPFWTRYAIGPTDLLRPLVLMTSIPGIAVALAWRERWPTFSYELLYPGGRRELAREMGLAMAIDFAEFWLAITLAAVLAIVVRQPRSLASSGVLITLVASALMQVLLCGGIFLAVQRRSWVQYALTLVVLAFVVTVPVAVTWSQQPSLTPQRLLVVALIEMIIGAGLFLLGNLAWRRGEFA